MKNYTSVVPVDRTILKIEQILMRAGASSIHKEFLGGEVVALTFCIEAEPGKSYAIRLPANVRAVEAILLEGYSCPAPTTRKRIAAQAGRTAWKVMQDWVEVQLALIEMQQAEFLQVFLPYVWDGRRTYFAQLQGGGFKELPMIAGKGE